MLNNSHGFFSILTFKDNRNCECEAPKRKPRTAIRGIYPKRSIEPDCLPINFCMMIDSTKVVTKPAPKPVTKPLPVQTR